MTEEEKKDSVEETLTEETQEETEVEKETTEESEGSSTEEVNWEEVAKAEKERADAAERLIIKNKNIQKREERKEQSGLTEERVLELIRSAQVDIDDPDAKALAEAQKRVKVLEAKNNEIIRAAKKKDTTSSDTAQTHRDGERAVAPKLPDNSPLKDYEHKGNGIYAKKLASGQFHYVRRNAQPGEKRSWVA